jgi:hypothetical protein
VDRYRDFKVRERVLSAESINKTITRLGQILAVAEERDLIARNPVRVNTRNRKLQPKRKRPVFLESAEQIAAMIDAATELDAKPEARTAGRRALIATLVYAGLRIGEATAVRWQDIDLANGRISVGDSKTEAGVRLVDILPALRDDSDVQVFLRADARLWVRARSPAFCGDSRGFGHWCPNDAPAACARGRRPEAVIPPGRRSNVPSTAMSGLPESVDTLSSTSVRGETPAVRRSALVSPRPTSRLCCAPAARC